MKVPREFIGSFLNNESDIDLLIEYGFLPSSIEYCLKYDDISAFKCFSFNTIINAKWSPFEWSQKPNSLDLLSFSGFFGSIQCFKHLLMNGFQINNSVISSVVCSGSLDLFHLCNHENIDYVECLCLASEFCQMPILKFLLENGVNLNSVNQIGWTPLHFAAEKSHLSIIEFLINHGAKLDISQVDAISRIIMFLLFIMLLKMVYYVW